MTSVETPANCEDSINAVDMTGYGSGLSPEEMCAIAMMVFIERVTMEL